MLGRRCAGRDRDGDQQATQQPRTTVTDASGFYTFPNLQPGRYDVSAELQGFKKATRAGVQLDAASALNLEFSLETGALTEEVTVTAEASILQTDVAVRKTVEAKDIEQLSFNGRNPIGVPGLKAGVIGGSFNNAGAMSLTAGGFNINGGRSDEAVVYVDGAVATRTRSAGSMVGVQNADTVQEVQVLTANYMPEYGRSSGGQIRFISKSGSNRYSGNASYLLERRVAAGQQVGPQPQSGCHSELGPCAIRPEAVRLFVRRTDPRWDVQGQAVLLRRAGMGELLLGATNTATVPTLKMRNGDFSELLGANPFFSSPQIIRDPTTGQPFPATSFRPAACRRTVPGS